MFRLLKENEIECKVSTVKEDGLQLLLYKTARTDMDLLDETLLPMNWECDYKEIKGNMYCGITLIDEKGNKITKWDCGTESVFGDKEKGEASDAFKRAGFKWGIGRELYTAPFIWINVNMFNLKLVKGKFATYDKFEVIKIGYNETKEINELQIKNITKDKIVYDMKKPVEPKYITDVETPIVQNPIDADNNTQNSNENSNLLNIKLKSGKHIGKTWLEVCQEDISYIDFLISKDNQLAIKVKEEYSKTNNIQQEEVAQLPF